MDVFGAVTAAIGAVDQSRKLLTSIHKRYQHLKEVPRKCEELSKRLEELEKILAELQSYETRNMPKMGKRIAVIIFEFSRHAKDILEEQLCKGETLSKAEQFIRAGKISNTMDGLINTARALELRGLIYGFASHQVSLSQTAWITSKDVIVAKYNIPPTPEGLVLNLNDSGACEGK